MRANTEKIAIAMVRACIDLEKLATLSGISYPATRRAVKGCEVKASTLGKICKALQVDPSELIAKEGE